MCKSEQGSDGHLVPGSRLAKVTEKFPWVGRWPSEESPGGRGKRSDQSVDPPTHTHTSCHGFITLLWTLLGPRVNLSIVTERGTQTGRGALSPRSLSVTPLTDRPLFCPWGPAPPTELAGGAAPSACSAPGGARGGAPAGLQKAPPGAGGTRPTRQGRVGPREQLPSPWPLSRPHDRAACGHGGPASRVLSPEPELGVRRAAAPRKPPELRPALLGSRWSQGSRHSRRCWPFPQSPLTYNVTSTYRRRVTSIYVIT